MNFIFLLDSDYFWHYNLWLKTPEYHEWTQVESQEIVKVRNNLNAFNIKFFKLATLFFYSKHSYWRCFSLQHHYIYLGHVIDVFSICSVESCKDWGGGVYPTYYFEHLRKSKFLPLFQIPPLFYWANRYVPLWLDSLFSCCCFVSSGNVRRRVTECGSTEECELVLS